MKNTNNIKVSYRFPSELVNDLNKHCEFRGIKKTNFVRDAIKEKLLRKSMEENLAINVNTNEIEHTLTEYIGLFEKKTNFLEDIVRQITVDMSTKFQDIKDILKIILGSLHLPKELENQVFKEDSIIDRLLALLPANIDDLYLNLGDIEQVNSLINDLERSKTIVFHKLTGMVELNE